MKRLAYIVLSLLVLVSCTSRQEYAAMRSGLDSMNERNRNDLPFAVSDVQPYADYFSQHGTPNDQMLAYYLLGRAYHEHGEAPMALENYQKAIESSDTTAADCDYKQLSRVYSQIGQILYEQALYRNFLQYYQFAEATAWKAKDTLNAIICHEQQGVAYRELMNPDSSVIIIEQTSQLFSRYGYHKDAAIALGSISRALLNMGYIDKASKYMTIYESESGLFNSAGEIEKGREAYYNTKGLFHFKRNRLDSAEYWFRKELHDGKDFNNQNGGALRLAMVYEQRHIPDSAAKYYHYAYAMNDSMYAQMVTDEVTNMQSMYNYTRYREIAHSEKERASRRAVIIWSCIAVIISLCLLGIILIERVNHKRREVEAKYFKSLDIISQARQDIEKLRANNNVNRDIIAEKEKAIDEQRNLLRALPANSLIYKRLTIQGVEPTIDEWKQIEEMTFELFPQFQSFLNRNEHLLNDKERKTCILIRAGFKPKNISNMLGVGPSYISNIRSEMLQKLFGKDDSPKTFDRLIKEMY